MLLNNPAQVKLSIRHELLVLGIVKTDFIGRFEYMIQRKQTLYLFALVFIGVLLLWINPTYAWLDSINQQNSYELHYWNTYATPSKQSNKNLESANETPPNGLKNTQVGAQKDSNAKGAPEFFAFMTCLLATGSGFAAIFLFKKRVLQKKVVLFSAALCMVLVGLLGLRFMVMKSSDGNCISHVGIPMIWPVMMAFLALLGIIDINKDQEKVRSMDRIR